MYDRVTASYEHRLACAFHRIDKRGLLLDSPSISSLKQEIIDEIRATCTDLTKNWQVLTYVGTIRPDTTFPYTSSVNINATSGEYSFLNTLKNLGYKVPKVKKKNKEGDTEHKESTNELALQLLFSETGDENIKKVLRIRELNKMLTTYINAKLWNHIYFCNYNVAATVTGRRGSKKHIFGYGGNAQNFPKHSKLGKKFRKSIIARPGHIFLQVDQMQAEDWPVSALANNLNALDELRKGVDRHTNLASYIFTIPKDSRTTVEWKESIERYLGKKARHANNYGMQPPRLSLALAQEGFSFDKKVCTMMLERVDMYDPNVKQVFHVYVRKCLDIDRTLRNPFGRERQFFGLRPNNPNYEIYNEAYSYIPQSTVGDNTGLAILYLDEFCQNTYIVQDCHDSIVQEVPEKEEELLKAFGQIKSAFNRNITFHNGISIQIPIEAELGYNLGELRSLKTMEPDELLKVWKDLREERAATNAKSLNGTVVG